MGGERVVRRPDDTGSGSAEGLSGLEPVLQRSTNVSRTPLTLLASGAVIALAGLALATAVAATGTPDPLQPTAQAATGKSATLHVGSTGLGRSASTSQGNTLYLFQQPTQATAEQPAPGACATNWPPLTSAAIRRSKRREHLDGRAHQAL